jgi:hypothetical protein
MTPPIHPDTTPPSPPLREISQLIARIGDDLAIDIVRWSDIEKAVHHTAGPRELQRLARFVPYVTELMDACWTRYGNTRPFLLFADLATTPNGIAVDVKAKDDADLDNLSPYEWRCLVARPRKFRRKRPRANKTAPRSATPSANGHADLTSVWRDDTSPLSVNTH